MRWGARKGAVPKSRGAGPSSTTYPMYPMSPQVFLTCWYAVGYDAPYERVDVHRHTNGFNTTRPLSPGKKASKKTSHCRGFFEKVVARVTQSPHRLCPTEPPGDSAITALRGWRRSHRPVCSQAEPGNKMDHGASPKSRAAGRIGQRQRSRANPTLPVSIASNPSVKAGEPGRSA